ncbi:hypothetical protein WDV76_12135 [Xenorhabdus griffiniae]|uniref:hypothetical protein n=1 Tax=Xenorhabdus griffiniae TaxID=351672 RepID=UPI0030CDBCDA
MPDPVLEGVFRELENTRNPSGIPVLCEYNEPTNQNRTLTAIFENENVRNDLRRRAHLNQATNVSISNSLPNRLHQLGFELDMQLSLSIRSHSQDGSVYRLANHTGYDVTLNAYKTIILPSFSPQDVYYINRFKERITERKYHNIQDALRNYQSPAPSPSRSPQPGPSGLHLPYQQVTQPPRQTGGTGNAFHPYRRLSTQPRQESQDPQPPRPGRIWRPWQ